MIAPSSSAPLPPRCRASWRPARSTVASLAILLASTAAPTLAAAEVVGRAGAVNPAATAAAGSASRVLELGANIIFRERVSTSAGGTAQLIFVDKTTLSVGPNASLVIDEFVYNPSAGTGTMAVSLARGVVRFVGGNTSHTGGATVTTPVATIGIRGGIATVRHDPNGTTHATLHFGSMTVSTPNGTEIVRRPGFGVTIAGGNAPSAPAKVSLAEIAEDREALTSKGEQRGSAPVSPTDRGAVRAGIDAVNRGVGTATLPVQRSAMATRSSPNTSTTVQNVALVAQGSTASPLTINAAARSTDAAVQQQVLARTDASPVTPPPPTNTTSSTDATNDPSTNGNPNTGPSTNTGSTTNTNPTTPTPTKTVHAAGRFALDTTIDPALNSTVPYVLGAAIASGGVSISPVYGYRAASADGVNAGPTRTLQVAFGLDGSGTGQSSNFLVATTSLRTQSDGSQVLAGGFQYAGRRAANLTMSRANGPITSLPGTLATDADGLPTRSDVNQNFRTSSTAIDPDTAFERPGGGGAGQNYTFQQTLTATSVPVTLGQARQTGTFTGYAAGMVRTLDNATNNNINEFAQPIAGTATLRTDASNSTVQLDLKTAAVNTAGRPGGAYLTGTHQLGSLAVNTQRGTYIDDSTFGAREAVSSTSVGSQTPVSSVNSVVLLNDHAATAVSTAIPSLQSYFPNTQFCQCEYTRWGFWSDETARQGYSDRIHLGTWVTGTPTPTVDMPTSGSATYSGHVIAALRAAGSEFVAASNMTNIADFGRGSITSTVTGLNGVAYAGSLTIGGGSNAATGTLTGAGGYSMTANGAFFGPVSRGSPPELAGSVTLAGPNNFAGAGIFQTRR